MQSNTTTYEQRVGTLAHWINERWRILQRKQARRPEPWTTDLILRTWRFCNVRREDDTVTRWIAEDWRTPHHDDPDVWFGMTVARMFNHPPTLRAIKYPKPWRPERTERVLLARQARGAVVFGPAYVISNGGQSIPKVPYVVGLLDEARSLECPPAKGDTLETAYYKLCKAPGLGSFMAAQVVADLKHTATLEDAPDWWDWAAPGPGSKMGLHWLDYGTLEKRSAPDFVARLLALRKELRPLLAPGVPRLCLQDLQNCLCELSKFVRGNGKQRYTSLESQIAELLG